MSPARGTGEVPGVNQAPGSPQPAPTCLPPSTFQSLRLPTGKPVRILELGTRASPWGRRPVRPREGLALPATWEEEGLGKPRDLPPALLREPSTSVRSGPEAAVNKVLAEPILTTLEARK